MAAIDPIQGLYADHHARLQARYELTLESASRETAIIASGAPVPVAGDDQSYPFRVNPRFRQWVPEGDYTDSFVVIRPGCRPILICHQPRDYWHAVAAPPSGFWADHFDIVCVATPEDAVRALPADGGRCAFLGYPGGAADGISPDSVNPPAMIHALDYHRVCKTDYEVECIRRANRLAAAGHLAAHDAFKAGASELDAHLAYLSASRHLERQLPYPNIVAYNEHGATLHYDRLENERPRELRSFLIDAGAACLGYAADVTRTWSAADDEFAALIGHVDRAQQALVDRVAVGMSYIDLHEEMHVLLGRVLADVGVVTMSPESMAEQGVTATFFPHGLGHHLGLQVHDVGGKLADERGNPLDQPEAHPFLRNLRAVEAGNVFTIEPGLYFIPELLDSLRAAPAVRDVNWDKVDELAPFGGVRIEDDVCVTRRGLENLTRDAFHALDG